MEAASVSLCGSMKILKIILSGFVICFFVKSLKSHLVFSALKINQQSKTNPINKDNEVIGWQAKFYDTPLSSHKNDLVNTIEKSKKRLSKYYKITFLHQPRVGAKKGEEATRLDRY